MFVAPVPFLFAVDFVPWVVPVPDFTLVFERVTVPVLVGVLVPVDLRFTVLFVVVDCGDLT